MVLYRTVLPHSLHPYKLSERHPVPLWVWCSFPLGPDGLPYTLLNHMHTEGISARNVTVWLPSSLQKVICSRTVALAQWQRTCITRWSPAWHSKQKTNQTLPYFSSPSQDSPVCTVSMDGNGIQGELPFPSTTLLCTKTWLLRTPLGLPITSTTGLTWNCQKNNKQKTKQATCISH